MSKNAELTPFLPFAQTERRTATRGAAQILSFRNRQMPIEPEDARITGTTRSLYRRLLALNLHKPAVAVTARETEPAFMPPLTA